MNLRIRMSWRCGLALLQGLLLLPTILGSVCLHDTGGATWEWGACECLVAAVGGEAAPTLGSPSGSPECGPCHDQALTALKGAPTTSGRSHLAAAIASFPQTHVLAGRASFAAEPRPSGAGPPRNARLSLRC